LSGGPFGPRNLEGFDDLCAYPSRDEAQKGLDANAYGDCERDKTGSETVTDIIAVLLPSVNGVDLSQTRLRKADLSWASLAKADLSFASLDHAVLRNTLLVDADLTNTDLRHADMTDTNLTGANLTNADLTGATGITNVGLQKQTCALKGAVMPDGIRLSVTDKPVNCQ
jgi:hypothetical protein